MRAIFFSVCCAIVAATSASAAPPTEPTRDSKLRAEMLDAARPFFEAATHGSVRFVVKRLNVTEDWAFGSVEVQRPDGGAIDQPKSESNHGDAYFLLTRSIRRAGNHWTLVEATMTQTDAALDTWKQTYHLPAELLETQVDRP